MNARIAHYTALANLSCLERHAIRNESDNLDATLIVGPASEVRNVMRDQLVEQGYRVHNLADGTPDGEPEIVMGELSTASQGFGIARLRNFLITTFVPNAELFVQVLGRGARHATNIHNVVRVIFSNVEEQTRMDQLLDSIGYTKSCIVYGSSTGSDRPGYLDINLINAMTCYSQKQKAIASLTQDNFAFAHAHALQKEGWYIGPRDPARNPSTHGSFMVCRNVDAAYTAENDPDFLIGFNLNLLIQIAHDRLLING